MSCPAAPAFSCDRIQSSGTAGVAIEEAEVLEDDDLSFAGGYSLQVRICLKHLARFLEINFVPELAILP